MIRQSVNAFSVKIESSHGYKDKSITVAGLYEPEENRLWWGAPFLDDLGFQINYKYDKFGDPVGGILIQGYAQERELSSDVKEYMTFSINYPAVVYLCVNNEDYRTERIPTWILEQYTKSRLVYIYIYYYRHILNKIVLPVILQ